MKKIIFNSLFIGFILSFGFAYVLLNSYVWVNDQHNNYISETIYSSKFKTNDFRPQSKSINFEKLPSYKAVNRPSLLRDHTIANQPSNDGNENTIVADYVVETNSRASFNENEIVGYSATSSGLAYWPEHYSSHKNTNATPSNENSGLNNLLSQFEVLKSIESLKQEDASTANNKLQHGFLTMNSDLTEINSSLSTVSEGMQKSTTSDPGGDDDLGDPIPVGDGWVFLMLLAVGYGLKVFMDLKWASNVYTVDKK